MTKRLLFLLLALFLACCDGGGPTDRTSQPNQGLVVSLPEAPLTLDPRLNIDAASYRLTQVIFNGLVRKGPHMDIVGDLAERWETPNELTWIFHIRSGVKFHNGREMTAEDVAYTYNSILDPELGSPKRQSFSVIDRIEVRGPYTVAFYTKEPFSPLPVNMTVGIVPAKEAKEAGQDFASNPVGTGPFRFVRMEPDRNIELAAFKDHFRGRPKIETLTFRVITDDTTRYLELIKGNLDFVQNAVTPDMIPVVENKPEFKVLKTPGTNYEYLAFNLKDPILKNRSVRAAIAHALDVPSMIASLHRGLAEPASGVLPPSNWAYEGEVERYPYDPVLARALLEEAGYPIGDEGYRFKLTYKTTLSDPARLKAEIIQHQLKEVGIELDVRGYDWGTFFSDVTSGNFQLFSMQWVGVSDPDIYQYIFSSASIPPNGANRGGYVNPRLDELVTEGRRTMGQEARKPIYSEVQKIAAADLPYVSLWHPTNVVVMRKDLEGFKPSPDGDLSSLWQIYRKAPAKGHDGTTQNKE